MQAQSEFYMLAIDIGSQLFLVCALERYASSQQCKFNLLEIKTFDLGSRIVNLYFYKTSLQQIGVPKCQIKPKGDCRTAQWFFFWKFWFRNSNMKFELANTHTFPVLLIKRRTNILTVLSDLQALQFVARRFYRRVDLRF